jgi:hypothetical protein
LFQTHERVIAEVDGFLRRVGDYADRYSSGVDRAVRAYAHTDANASARIDATLPGFVDPGQPAHRADQSLGPEIFADAQCLTLDPPPDFKAQFPYQPSWADLISPASTARDAVWGMTWVLAKLGLLKEPYDPYETVTVPLCGDWAGLARTGVALQQVAKAVTYVSDRVDEGAATLDRVWTGHAAGNCRYALRHFAADLPPGARLISEIADHYTKVATTAREQGEALGTMISLLVDLGCSFGVELGVELTVEVSLTEVVGGGERLVTIAHSVGEIIETIGKSLELLDAAVEGAREVVPKLCDGLAILAYQPIHVNLPDDLPALPVPAHR